MSIQAVRELPRVFEREIGKSPTELSKRFVVTLSDNILSGAAFPTIDQIATALGLAFPTTFGTGTAWEAPYTQYRLRKVRIEEAYEGNPYEVLVTATFGIIDPDELQNPTARAATWKVESQTIEVPALFYYHGSGNGDKRPLTNSANDYFQGLTMSEPVVRLRYFKNFAATRASTGASPYGGFPWSIVNAENSVNNASWGSAAIHTCRVENVTVDYDEEDYNGTLYALWKVDAVITYRPTTWNMQLPDVGWNFLESGQKRRAMVFDFNNSEWVASPNPVGLNGSGALTLGTPAVLDRRTSPEANFTTLFGNPPA